MCYLSAHCTVYLSAAQSRAKFKVWGTQKKSYDVDTRDIARVRKHPGLTGQHINLATNTACSYLLCTRASPGTKEALPQTALQVLDIFITLLAASILRNKRSPPLVCHLRDKAKPRQMNSSACDCFKRGGEGSILSHIFLTQQHGYNKCALFG